MGHDRKCRNSDDHSHDKHHHKVHCKTGPTGPQGPRGATGPKGDKGAQGSQGPQGATGLQGPSGNRGDVGVRGPPGCQGPEGCRGPRGCRGADGPVGPKGPKGDTGSQGPQGIPGPNTGLTGPAGPEGPTGNTGPVGVTGPAGGSPPLLYATIPGPLPVPTSVFFTALWSNIVVDEGYNLSPLSGQFSPPVDGFYQVSAEALWEADGSGGRRIHLVKDLNDYIAVDIARASQFAESNSLCVTVPLLTSSTYRIQYWQNGAATLDLNDAGSSSEGAVRGISLGVSFLREL